MPCNDCSRAEDCPPCVNEGEPQGSEHSLSDHHRCKCGHIKHVHSKLRAVESCNFRPCGCQGFVCDHSRCGWKPREDPEPRCVGCGHAEGEGCGCPPLTSEEEEELPPEPSCCGNPHCTCEGSCDCDSEAPEDEEPQPCPQCGSEADSWYDRSICAEPCGSSHNRCSDCGTAVGGCPIEAGEGPPCSEVEGCDGNCCAKAPPPPQPDRRPPYAVAYSVQGHLYEVALPGDATVHAVDGALVIRHHLGPVAGIVQVLPVINKETGDAQADQ
jgi:hypothetical protein